MGYACPVCEEPQADTDHLANHVAFTAMLHGDDHESWLSAHVPEWADMGPDELGPAVAEHATETDHPEPSDHDHDHPPTVEDELAREGGYGRDVADDAAEVLAEAERLTREMYGEDGDTETE